MFLNSNVNSVAKQRHLLSEQLTQALGLNNFIDYYPHSLFYQDCPDVIKHVNIDTEII